ncbi:14392_t:CDS:1, partial [Cetraspora pellucida]
YLYLKPRFKQVKESIQANESLFFIVGTMKVIDNDFYVYAKDINNIHIPAKNIINDKNQTPSTSIKSTRSKLLFAHQNIKNTETSSNAKLVSDNIENKYQHEISANDSHLQKHKRTNDTDEPTNDPPGENNKEKKTRKQH